MVSGVRRRARHVPASRRSGARGDARPCPASSVGSTSGPTTVRRAGSPGNGAARYAACSTSRRPWALCPESAISRHGNDCPGRTRVTTVSPHIRSTTFRPGTPRRSLGSTGPAPTGRSPYLDAQQPAPGTSPRQRGHHPGARPRRARGRDRRAARRGARRRRAPSTRSSPCWSARSGPTSRRTPSSTEAQRAEQLKRLDGIATILAKTAARDTSLLHAPGRGRRGLRLGPRPAPPDARGRRRRAARGGARAGRDRRRGPRRPRAASYPQSVVQRQLVQPVPRARLHRRPARQRQGPPAGRLGAARPAVPLVRVRQQRPVLHGAARAREGPGPAAGRPRADAPPGAAGRRRRRGPPHLPARRRARPRQDRAGAARGPGRGRVPAAGRRARTS